MPRTPPRPWPDRRRLPPVADEGLISLVRSGDAGAFAELHARHSKAAHRLSRRMIA